MPVEGIISPTIQVLAKVIDLRAKSQNLISSNIANAETPGYIPRNLSFEDELQGAIKTRQTGQTSSPASHPRHIPLKTSTGNISSVSGKVIETPAKTPGKDGNAVEMENEMSRLLENQVMYNANVQILSKKFEGLKTAIREGR